MAKVVFSNRARRSLVDILDYISRDNPEAALKLILELENRVVETLRTFPEAGAKWQGGRRFLAVRRYSVVYSHDEAKDEVVVVAGFSPGSDWR